MEDARQETEKFVNHYNNERLHGAIGYIAPVDKQEGRAQAIIDDRKRKLAEAQERRKAKYAAQQSGNPNTSNDRIPLDIPVKFEESQVTR